MIKAKKVTTVRRKFIGVPKTNQEKFDKMKIKNHAIERLRDIFDLEIAL